MKKTVLILAWLCWGCVVNRHLGFTDKVAGPGYLVARTAAVSVQDLRPEVLSGKEKASCCGHNYSTLHIRYPIQTRSGEPLADEFTRAISATYAHSGATAQSLMVSSEITADSLMHLSQASGKERWLQFRILEWDASAVPGFSTLKYTVKYHLSLTVLDAAGVNLAEASEQGQVEQKEGAFLDVSLLQSLSDQVLKDKVAALFDAPGVKKSLTAE